MRNRLSRQCIFILLLALALGLAFNLTMPQGIGLLPPEISAPLYETISLDKASELRKSGAAFVDARDAGDYKRGHVRKALNLPVEDFERMWPYFVKMIEKAPAVVVYGGYYSRAPEAQIAQRIKQSGLEKVYMLEAGFSELKEAGYPVRMPFRVRKAS